VRARLVFTCLWPAYGPLLQTTCSKRFTACEVRNIAQNTGWLAGWLTTLTKDWSCNTPRQQRSEWRQLSAEIKKSGVSMVLLWGQRMKNTCSSTDTEKRMQTTCLVIGSRFSGSCQRSKMVRDNKNYSSFTISLCNLSYYHACRTVSTFLLKNWTPWHESASEVCRPSDRRRVGQVNAKSADRWYHVVSVTHRKMRLERLDTLKKNTSRIELPTIRFVA
jgi:hypothetical protein